MNPAEDYILSQEEPFKSILLHLQMVIDGLFPEVDLKYKYRIPFYYFGKKPFCYLNKPKKKNYVDVGFWSAAHLTKHLEHLVTEKRKHMKSLRYTSMEDIDDAILVAVLKDAYSVNDKGFYKK